MNNLSENILKTLNDIGRAFCNFSLTMLVQASVLIVLLFIIDIIIRKRVRATFRYWIWMLVFIKLVLPPALSLPTGIGNWFSEYFVVNTADFDRKSDNITKQKTEPVQSVKIENTEFVPQQIPQLQNDNRPFVPQAASKSEISPQLPTNLSPEGTTINETADSISNPLTWQGGIFLIWLVGVLVLSVVLVQRVFFVKGLIAQSEPVKNRLLETLQDCSKQLGIRRNLQMKLSYNASSPAVCGLFNPVILIPRGLLEKISHEKFSAILIHELSHIKRADLWVNCMQTILQIIYFYNPLVWLVNAIVRRIREQAVDEMVLVALGAEAKSYSNTLIDVAEMAFSRPTISLRLVGVVESKKALSERIKHILSRPIPKSAKLGILGLLVILAAAAILLPMAKKAKINYYIDGVEGYIRCSVTHSESSRAILNMAQVYNFKHERSRGSGDDESPIKYSTDNYIIPDNKKLTFETVAEKGQQLRIDISVEPGAIYTTEEITIELARQLGILPKTAKQLKKKEMLSELSTDKADFFRATLSSGVTVELVGLCREPVEGAKWWKPNGDEMPEPSFEASTRTSPMGDIPTRYTFLAKAQGGEDISMKAKIYEGFGNLTKIAQDGTALCFIKYPDNSKPHHEDAFEKGPVEIGIAQGQWIKRQNVGEALHIPRSYLIGNNDQIVIQPPRADNAEPNMVTNIWASVTSYDYEFKLVCKLKDGSTRESEQAYFQSANIIETGGLHSSAIKTFTFLFDRLTYDQIVDYELFYRKFEYVRFNNVAFKPDIKTDVEIVTQNNSAAEKADKNQNVMNETNIPAEMTGTWFFDNPMGDDEQMAIFPDGKVVVLYSNGHKDQTNYENGIIELAEYDNAKYKLSIQENGTLIEYIDSQESGLAKIWRRIDTQPQTELIKSLTGTGDIKTDVNDEQNKKHISLEFRIAPDSVESSRNPSPLKPEQELKYKEDLRQNGPDAGKKRNDEYIWIPIREGTEVSFLISEDYKDSKYLLVCNKKPFVLLPDEVWEIENISTISDSRGLPAISVEIDEKGGELFYKLTSGNINRSLAIIIGDKVTSIPVIRSPLRNKLMITGSFTKEELQNMSQTTQPSP